MSIFNSGGEANLLGTTPNGFITVITVRTGIWTSAPVCVIATGSQGRECAIFTDHEMDHVHRSLRIQMDDRIRAAKEKGDAPFTYRWLCEVATSLRSGYRAQAPESVKIDSGVLDFAEKRFRQSVGRQMLTLHRRTGDLAHSGAELA